MIGSLLVISQTVATVPTACGIETILQRPLCQIHNSLLQQCLPLAVLKQYSKTYAYERLSSCNSAYRLRYWNSRIHASRFTDVSVATVPTACGIETFLSDQILDHLFPLQQCLPLAVCDEGCEAAEERSDDEVRTSLVPDRREGKTKVMK